MKHKLILILIGPALLGMSWLLAGQAFAHGVGFSLIPEARPMAVRFYYTGNTPMAYAETGVRGPGPDRPEFQNGRTDCNGIFAFCPDRPGKWKLTVNDGRGHRVRAVVSVPESPEPVQAAPDNKNGAKPGWLEVIAGISLLLNIGVIPAYIKFLRKS